MKNLKALSVALFASCFLAAPVTAAEPTLETVKKTGVLKLGYRENSPPFSFVASGGKPQGYSIELCQHVAVEISTLLKLPVLETKWVPVDANSRFNALKSGEIDIECGNTTQTLARRAEFDFSVMTYVDGAGLLYRFGERPISVDDMRGQRFAVVAGTTTEKILDKLVATSKLGAQLIRVKDHDAAIAALNDKTATAYAADRTVLLTTAMTQGKGTMYDIASVQFSYEPYGLMMRRDADLRLTVDRTLSRLYRSGEIELSLQRWFAGYGSFTDALKAMFQLNALPE
jgi:ABC-type amino acid transport substrate-binding protein